MIFDSAACTVYIKKQIICQPLAMKYNNTLYYYVLNAQGDVIALADQNGNLIAKYSYDPWGKLLSVTPNGWLDEQNAYYLEVAEANPLRYRGYYYDSETGFYYLQSRYYDPEIGRFINADSYASTDATGLLSTNMFAYCENNPVMRVDPTGELFWDILDVFMAALSWDDFLESPSLVNLGWAALDTLALLPGVPSSGYARRGIELASSAYSGANKLSDFAYAAKYGVGTYRDLRKLTNGTGLEVHHVIEKRFSQVVGMNKNDMLSVVLTKEEHGVFTRRWRNAIPYGTIYSEVTRSQLWNAAKNVYIDHPELLDIAKRTIYPKGVR